MFYVAETGANEFVNNQALWSKVASKDLTGAKRAATNARMFQRTAAWVGKLGADGVVQPVAVKRCDAISGRQSTWVDL